jgi:hypothetical protein
MPFGLGHIYIVLLALLSYAAIIVGVVMVIRAIVVGSQRLAKSSDSLDAIQRTLVEIKSAIEALQKQQ